MRWCWMRTDVPVGPNDTDKASLDVVKWCQMLQRRGDPRWTRIEASRPASLDGGGGRLGLGSPSRGPLLKRLRGERLRCTRTETAGEIGDAVEIVLRFYPHPTSTHRGAEVCNTSAAYLSYSIFIRRASAPLRARLGPQALPRGAGVFIRALLSFERQRVTRRGIRSGHGAAVTAIQGSGRP